MKNERMMELLKSVVDHVAVSNNTSEQIDELMNMGFTADELVKEFNYSKEDVEYYTGESIAEEPEKKYKLHARVTREIKVTHDQMERLYNLLSGCVEHSEIDDIRRQFTDGVDSGYYEKGVLPIDWAMADLDEQFKSESGLSIFDEFCYAGTDFVLGD